MPATITKNDDPILGSGDGGGNLDDLLGYGGSDGDGDKPEPERTPPPEGYKIGMWLVLVSVTMLFAALASAYIFNSAQAMPIVMPKVLWLSTTIILVSSATLEIARRALKRRVENSFRLWIGVTTALGFSFLIAQLIAWRHLSESGFYVNRNLHSGYSYLFTGLHGVHLIGGLAGLLFVTLRNQARWTALRRRVALDVTALFWHFLTGLWIILFVMLFFWK